MFVHSLSTQLRRVLDKTSQAAAARARGEVAIQPATRRSFHPGRPNWYLFQSSPRRGGYQENTARPIHASFRVERAASGQAEEPKQLFGAEVFAEAEVLSCADLRVLGRRRRGGGHSRTGHGRTGFFGTPNSSPLKWETGQDEVTGRGPAL